MAVRYSVFQRRLLISTDVFAAHWTSCHSSDVGEKCRTHSGTEKMFLNYRIYRQACLYDTPQNTQSHDEDDGRNAWLQTANKHKWTTFLSRFVQCVATVCLLFLKHSRSVKFQSEKERVEFLWAKQNVSSSDEGTERKIDSKASSSSLKPRTKIYFWHCHLRQTVGLCVTTRTERTIGPVWYWSPTVNDAENRYDSTLQEFIAVVCALLLLWRYIELKSVDLPSGQTTKHWNRFWTPRRVPDYWQDGEPALWNYNSTSYIAPVSFFKQQTHHPACQPQVDASNPLITT